MSEPPRTESQQQAILRLQAENRYILPHRRRIPGRWSIARQVENLALADHEASSTNTPLHVSYHRPAADDIHYGSQTFSPLRNSVADVDQGLYGIHSNADTQDQDAQHLHTSATAPNQRVFELDATINPQIQNPHQQSHASEVALHHQLRDMHSLLDARTQDSQHLHVSITTLNQELRNFLTNLDTNTQGSRDLNSSMVALNRGFRHIRRLLDEHLAEAREYRERAHWSSQHQTVSHDEGLDGLRADVSLLTTHIETTMTAFGEASRRQFESLQQFYREVCQTVVRQNEIRPIGSSVSMQSYHEPSPRYPQLHAVLRSRSAEARYSPINSPSTASSSRSGRRNTSLSLADELHISRASSGRSSQMDTSRNIAEELPPSVELPHQSFDIARTANVVLADSGHEPESEHAEIAESVTSPRPRASSTVNRESSEDVESEASSVIGDEEWTDDHRQQLGGWKAAV
ncbi:hypothetical protein KCV07_g3767, partial [Aureobasidium melanogenum]